MLAARRTLSPAVWDMLSGGSDSETTLRRNRAALDSLALRQRVLAKAVKGARGNRREVLGKIHESVRRALAQAKIKAEIQGREKTIFQVPLLKAPFAFTSTH